MEKKLENTDRAITLLLEFQELLTNLNTAIIEDKNEESIEKQISDISFYVNEFVLPKWNEFEKCLFEKWSHSE